MSIRIDVRRFNLARMMSQGAQRGCHFEVVVFITREADVAEDVIPHCRIKYILNNFRKIMNIESLNSGQPSTSVQHFHVRSGAYKLKNLNIEALQLQGSSNIRLSTKTTIEGG